MLSRPLSSPVASPSRRFFLVAEIGWIGPPFSPSVPPAAERRGAAVYIDLARKLVWSHIVAREGFVIAEFGFAVSAKGDRVLDRSSFNSCFNFLMTYLFYSQELQCNLALNYSVLCPQYYSVIYPRISLQSPCFLFIIAV